MGLEESKTDLVKATIYTNKFKIIGLIRIAQRDSYRGRLSDYLNISKSQFFIPVSKAAIYDTNNQELIYETNCVIINKGKIEAIIEEDGGD